MERRDPSVSARALGEQMSQLESLRVLLVDDGVRLLESMAAVLAEKFAMRSLLLELASE